MSSTPKPRLVPQRVSVTRHDLRNPLGEIQGFADILAEEARELGHAALVTDLQALSQSTGVILRHLNETLSVEHLEASPAASETLGRALQLFSQQACVAATSLHTRCARIEGQPFVADLLRICESATRLGEVAPVLLADLFESPLSSLDGLDVMHPNDGTSGETVFFRKPAGTVAVAPGSEDTTFLTRAEVRPPATGTILIVDDTESNRALLTRRLSREGFTVALAENGRRALDMLGRHAFDLVLLDIMMPEMDGHQVLTAMKSDFALRHIPVIMISGLDDLDTLVRCIQGGAEDYLTKPFDPVLLRARIGACLDKKHLRDREREHLTEIEEQRRRADQLLHVILPHAIAEELKRTQSVRPQRHENVAVLFSDVAGFTAYCDQNPPELVMENLQTLVRECEDIALRHGLEKIKTIGDAFMAAGGLIDPLENPSLNCVRAALEMTRAAEALPCKWTMHVGIHIGPVVAGVVGRTKYMYDIWGDTVNTAARVAGVAGSGHIHVSADVWSRVSGHVLGASSGLHPLKGKGDLELFHIESLRR
ncbi:MAG: adenylate/guanylate cyclase domain-containing protein [Limisphaerales bacterium]